jgi:hypothetical protein
MLTFSPLSSEDAISALFYFLNVLPAEGTKHREGVREEKCRNESESRHEHWVTTAGNTSHISRDTSTRGTSEPILFLTDYSPTTHMPADDELTHGPATHDSSAHLLLCRTHSTSRAVIPYRSRLCISAMTFTPRQQSMETEAWGTETTTWGQCQRMRGSDEPHSSWDFSAPKLRHGSNPHCCCNTKLVGPNYAGTAFDTTSSLPLEQIVPAIIIVCWNLRRRPYKAALITISTSRNEQQLARRVQLYRILRK